MVPYSEKVRVKVNVHLSLIHSVSLSHSFYTINVFSFMQLIPYTHVFHKLFSHNTHIMDISRHSNYLLAEYVYHIRML